MPSRPPSPAEPPAATPVRVCTGVTTGPSESGELVADGGPPEGAEGAGDAPATGPTLRIRALSRSVTSPVPSGRKAMPHGMASPLAITSTAPPELSPLPPGGVGDTLGVGSRGGAPAWSGGGAPKLHPARVVTAAASRAANASTRGFLGAVTGPSLTGAAQKPGPPGERRRSRVLAEPSTPERDIGERRRSRVLAEPAPLTGACGARLRGRRIVGTREGVDRARGRPRPARYPAGRRHGRGADRAGRAAAVGPGHGRV